MNKQFFISEIFGKTIQGEGSVQGLPTVFVRVGGCEFRCSWCDSLHAVETRYKHEWVQMSAEEIFETIQKISPIPILVTLSGGNPALYDFTPLLTLGKSKGYSFCCETQGSRVRSWFCLLDYLTLSPKPPSSLMQTDWEKLELCLAMVADVPSCHTSLKIVIFDEKDYVYARSVAKRYPQIPMYLQVGNSTPPQVGPFDQEALLERCRWLVQKVLRDEWHTVRVGMQFHTLLWQNTRGT